MLVKICVNAIVFIFMRIINNSMMIMIIVYKDTIIVS